MQDFSKLQQALEKTRLPAIVVDLAAFDRNVLKLARRVRDSHPNLTLRIATKSLRVPSLIKRAQALSPVYRGLMCYSAEEIPFLAKHGFDDFLLAYPTLQANSLEALAHCARDKKVCVVVDSLQGVEALARAATAASSVVGCVLEFDVSWRLWGGLQLGARRSPLRNAEDIIRLHAKILALPSLRYDGLMAYEGQVAGVQDRSSFKGYLLNRVTSWIRQKEASSVAGRRARILEDLKKRGLTSKIVNGGGSGSLSFALKEKHLSEIAVGSALLASHLFTSYSNLEVEEALFVALEVVRSSESGWITCAGGGYIASGSPGWDRLLVPVYPKGAELSPLEGCGEVQTPLRVSAATSRDFSLGQAAFFRPSKAGEIAERFVSYQLWDGSRIETVPTYRGLGECFL